MPMLKICTPPPDMYSMNACMGKDLTGEIAKSQAFRVFKSSYEFTAFAFALAPVAVVVPLVVVIAEDLLLPAAFPYNRYIYHSTVSISSIHSIIRSVGRNERFGDNNNDLPRSPPFRTVLC